MRVPKPQVMDETEESRNSWYSYWLENHPNAIKRVLGDEDEQRNKNKFDHWYDQQLSLHNAGDFSAVDEGYNMASPAAIQQKPGAVPVEPPALAEPAAPPTTAPVTENPRDVKPPTAPTPFQGQDAGATGPRGAAMREFGQSMLNPLREALTQRPTTPAGQAFSKLFRPVLPGLGLGPLTAAEKARSGAGIHPGPGFQQDVADMQAGLPPANPDMRDPGAREPSPEKVRADRRRHEAMLERGKGGNVPANLAGAFGNWRNQNDPEAVQEGQAAPWDLRRSPALEKAARGERVTADEALNEIAKYPPRLLGQLAKTRRPPTAEERSLRVLRPAQPGGLADEIVHAQTVRGPREARPLTPLSPKQMQLHNMPPRDRPTGFPETPKQRALREQGTGPEHPLGAALRPTPPRPPAAGPSPAQRQSEARRSTINEEIGRIQQQQSSAHPMGTTSPTKQREFGELRGAVQRGRQPLEMRPPGQQTDVFDPRQFDRGYARRNHPSRFQKVTSPKPSARPTTGIKGATANPAAMATSPFAPARTFPGKTGSPADLSTQTITQGASAPPSSTTTSAQQSSLDVPGPLPDDMTSRDQQGFLNQLRSKRRPSRFGEKAMTMGAKRIAPRQPATRVSSMPGFAPSRPFRPAPLSGLEGITPIESRRQPEARSSMPMREHVPMELSPEGGAHPVVPLHKSVARRKKRPARFTSDQLMARPNPVPSALPDMMRKKKKPMRFSALPIHNVHVNVKDKSGHIIPSQAKYDFDPNKYCSKKCALKYDKEGTDRYLRGFKHDDPEDCGHDPITGAFSGGNNCPCGNPSMRSGEGGSCKEAPTSYIPKFNRQRGEEMGNIAEPHRLRHISEKQHNQNVKKIDALDRQTPRTKNYHEHNQKLWDSLNPREKYSLLMAGARENKNPQIEEMVDKYVGKFPNYTENRTLRSLINLGISSIRNKRGQLNPQRIIGGPSAQGKALQDMVAKRNAGRARNKERAAEGLAPTQRPNPPQQEKEERQKPVTEPTPESGAKMPAAAAMPGGKEPTKKKPAGKQPKGVPAGWPTAGWRGPAKGKVAPAKTTPLTPTEGEIKKKPASAGKQPKPKPAAPTPTPEPKPGPLKGKVKGPAAAAPAAATEPGKEKKPDGGVAARIAQVRGEKAAAGERPGMAEAMKDLLNQLRGGQPTAEPKLEPVVPKPKRKPKSEGERAKATVERILGKPGGKKAPSRPGEAAAGARIATPKEAEPLESATTPSVKKIHDMAERSGRRDPRQQWQLFNQDQRKHIAKLLAQSGKVGKREMATLKKYENHPPRTGVDKEFDRIIPDLMGNVARLASRRPISRFHQKLHRIYRYLRAR